MKAIVGTLLTGLLVLVACNNGGGGGGGGGTTGATGFAATPQPCNVATAVMGMTCPAQSQALVMPGAWVYGTGWSFPNPWTVNSGYCGCPNVGVSANGMTWTTAQRPVFFAASNSVACAPVDYFYGQQPLFTSQTGGVTSNGMYGGFGGFGGGSFGGGAFGFGAYYGSGYAPTNFRTVNVPQTVYGATGSASASQCLASAVAGCDLALERNLQLGGGRMRSQCGGGYCIPASADVNSTLGFCSALPAPSGTYNPGMNTMPYGF